MEKLTEIKDGDDSLIYVDQANKLIRAINALLQLEVSPATIGRFLIEEGSSKLDLSTLVIVPAPPNDGGAKKLVSNAGVMSWVDDTGGSGLPSGYAEITRQLLTSTGWESHKLLAKDSSTTGLAQAPTSGWAAAVWTGGIPGFEDDTSECPPPV